MGQRVQMTLPGRGGGEDEVEVCFRRTVGDQKTGERSVGYLKCGCIRVWKEEVEESGSVVLWSSEGKMYVLKEEQTHSNLTHRLGWYPPPTCAAPHPLTPFALFTPVPAVGACRSGAARSGLPRPVGHKADYGGPGLASSEVGVPACHHAAIPHSCPPPPLLLSSSSGRVHAGAASEYVFVTRSCAITGQLLTFMVGSTPGAAVVER